jgi:predicted Rossmann fold flavoprotein
MSDARTDKTEWDIVVIGAGAAGLMAGITAARRDADLQVLVLDGAKKVGAKILVSGGNRCNVTNEDVHAARFHTESDPAGPSALKGDGSKSFVGRVLRAFNAQSTRRFFESIGVELKLEPTGKYFPTSNSSRTVLNALLRELENAGATLRTGERVVSLAREGDGWRVGVQSEAGASTCTYAARAVILCSGGKALPKTGSDGAGYEFALALGHTLIRTTPALTPLLSEPVMHAHMAGLTLPVRLKLQSEAQVLEERAGSFLFTHGGYSGPVALNLSRHVARRRWELPGARVVASWLHEVPSEDEGRWWQGFVRDNAKKSVANALKPLVPERLATEIGAPFEGTPLGRLSTSQSKALRAALFAHELPVGGVDGYVKAEATAGGISLAEIEPITMMSKLADGLFLAGEVCDVDGWLGGYNFQWAWSSGVVAGRAAARWAAQKRPQPQQHDTVLR